MRDPPGRRRKTIKINKNYDFFLFGSFFEVLWIKEMERMRAVAGGRWGSYGEEIKTEIFVLAGFEVIDLWFGTVAE
jgi:hypothetical protein